jgi:hypothetical protein
VTSVALAWDVQRRSRYAGAGCEHHLLLQVTRPSYPNADAGAEEAAYAFQESAFAHLRGWYEAWVLARICADAHEVELLGDLEPDESVDGPGFRWLDHDGRRVFFLRDAGEDGDLHGSLDG